MKTTWQVLAVSLTSCLALLAAHNQDPLATWSSSPPLAPWEDELTCANYSTTAWDVASREGRLEITMTDAGRPAAVPPGLAAAASSTGFSLERPGQLSALRVDGGWFVGMSRGEFEGGGLWWLPDGGRVERMQEDNVTDFVSVRGRHFALSGVTHQDVQKGRVIELIPNAAGPRAEVLADLGVQPKAVELATSGALTVACSHGVAVISPSRRVSWLSKSDYSAAFPRSIATDAAGNVYVGMNRFVVKLERQGAGYRERWYRTAACTRFELDLENLTCKCAGRKE